MRAYAFTLLNLGAGHRALQAAHAICRIRSEYNENRLSQKIWDDWEENSSTIIMLNGGFVGDLKNTNEFLQELSVDDPSRFMFPILFSAFKEDKYTLNESMTAIAAIIHPRYYTPIALARENKNVDLAELTQEYQSVTEALFLLNLKEPNVNDRVDSTCFENYSQEEQDFIIFLSKFNLAHLG